MREGVRGKENGGRKGRVGVQRKEARIKKLGGRELRAVGKLMPGEKEVAENPRARSSVLRIAEMTNA